MNLWFQIIITSDTIFFSYFDKLQNEFLQGSSKKNKKYTLWDKNVYFWYSGTSAETRSGSLLISLKNEPISSENKKKLGYANFWAIFTLNGFWINIC